VLLRVLRVFVVPQFYLVANSIVISGSRVIFRPGMLFEGRLLISGLRLPRSGVFFARSGVGGRRRGRYRRRRASRGCRPRRGCWSAPRGPSGFDGDGQPRRPASKLLHQRDSGRADGGCRLAVSGRWGRWQARGTMMRRTTVCRRVCDPSANEIGLLSPAADAGSFKPPGSAGPAR